jgi:hypothetical protein
MVERKRTRSNGEGGVYKYQNTRGDGTTSDRWRGTATVGFSDGKQQRKTVTGRTKGEVLDKLRELQTANDLGVELPRADLTVGKFLDDWIQNVLPGTVRGSTLQQYTDVVKLYINPVLGRKRVRTLSARDVSSMQQFLANEYLRRPDADGRQAKGVAPHTQRIARSVLRRALRWAQQEGKVARNVASIAEGVKINQADRHRPQPGQASIDCSPSLEALAWHRAHHRGHKDTLEPPDRLLTCVRSIRSEQSPPPSRPRAGRGWRRLAAAATWS